MSDEGTSNRRDVTSPQERSEGGMPVDDAVGGQSGLSAATPDIPRRGQPRGSARSKPKKPVKGQVVGTRLDPEGVANLGVIAEFFGGTSDAETLRQLIEMFAGMISGGELDKRGLTKEVQARRPQVVEVSRADLDKINKALAEVAKGYSERAKEIYAIGHNVNQLTRLAHVNMDHPRAEALRDIEAALVRIRQQLNTDAGRDAGALEVLSCLRSS